MQGTVRWEERQEGSWAAALVLLCEGSPGEPMHTQTPSCQRQPLFCTARPLCSLFIPSSLCQHEPCPPTSVTLELGTQGFFRGPSSVCSQMSGTETSATAGERHRNAAFPWGLAQQGALGADSCRREASCHSSIY